MNNLLRDIIQQEILSINPDRTGLLERIIRKELLAEQSYNTGWKSKILNYKLGGDSDFRNPRVAIMDNRARRNGADFGFVVISHNKTKGKAIPPNLRDDVIELIRNEPNSVGVNEYYDKEKFMFVLSNPIKRTRRSVKWHVWVIDKRPLMQIVNKIKSADDELYYRLYPAVEKINKASVHNPQQSAGWVEMLKSAAKKANVEIPGAVANLNIQNIQKDVKLGSIKPFEVEVDEDGAAIDPKYKPIIFSDYLKGTPEKPGKVLVKYAVDGMNYQLIPIYGKGAVTSKEKLVGDRGYHSSDFIGNWDENGMPAEGEIIVRMDQSPGTIFSYFKGTVDARKKAGTTWDKPSYFFTYKEGFVQYVDTNQKPDGTFTGTFDGGINRPKSGKYGGSLKNTTGNAWEFDGTYKNGVQAQGTWTIPNTTKFVGKGPLETRNGNQTDLINGTVIKGQWKDNKTWNTTQFNVLGQETGATVKGKFKEVDEDSNNLKRDSKGPAVKKLKELLMITKQTEYIPDDEPVWTNFLTEKDTDVIGPYTTVLIKVLKSSWSKRGYKSKKVGNEYTDVVNQKFIETLHKLNSDPVKYDSKADPKIQLESLMKKFNLKQIVLQEYNNIITEQFSQEEANMVNDTMSVVVQNIKQNKPVDQLIKKQSKKVQKKVIQQIEKAVTNEFVMGYIQNDYIHINPPRPNKGTINAGDFVIISNTNWIDGVHLVNDTWTDKSGKLGAIKISTGKFLGYDFPERIMEGRGRIKLISQKELIDNLDKFPGAEQKLKDLITKNWVTTVRIAEWVENFLHADAEKNFDQFSSWNPFRSGPGWFDREADAANHLSTSFYNKWGSTIKQLKSQKLETTTHDNIKRIERKLQSAMKAIQGVKNIDGNPSWGMWGSDHWITLDKPKHALVLGKKSKEIKMPDHGQGFMYNFNVDKVLPN